MAKLRELEPEELLVLKLLSACAERTRTAGTTARPGKKRKGPDRGWTRRGVTGWKFTDEIEVQAPCPAAAVLPYLAGRGLVRRERVPDPGRPRRPMMIHRITPAGEAELAAQEGREPRPIAPPSDDDSLDADILYLIADAWNALAVLKTRPAGEHGGWMEYPAIQKGVRGRRLLFTEDLAFLIRRGLAERQRPPGRPPQAGTLYRATALGRRVVLVEKQEMRVQVRLVPGPGADSEEAPAPLPDRPTVGSGG